MRKINFYLLLVSLFLGTSAYAQDYATTKGDMLVDFGVGIGRAYGYYDSYNDGYNNNNGYRWNGNNHIIIPTISMVIQKAFWDDITIGGFAAFNLYGDNYSQSGPNYYQEWKTRETSFMIGARGEYHFNRLIDLDSRFDLYAGAMAGVRIWGAKWERHDSNGDYSSNANGADPLAGIFGGFRYYFSNNLSVYGEAGWAVNNLRAGLCWRL